MTRKIAVVTGSRAEYGLLQPLMEAIRHDASLELQVIVTGMHLSPEFGSTYRVIEADGFRIDGKVETLLSSDSPTGVAKAIGLGVIGFADAFARLTPDMIVVLGDRFEILAAAQAAMVFQIPVAHLAGGDTGAGTYDNVIRHCITKIASLHFVTHDEARRRVVQLGERPDRVFDVGATSVDNIVNLSYLSREEMEKSLGITLRDPLLLITFHPLTMDEHSAGDELAALLSALDGFQKQHGGTMVFTKANADNGGRAVNAAVEAYVASRPDAHLFASLGQARYLSLMKLAALVVGNSSSGVYEAPYLRTPTVDIGSRQRGRAAPTSVVRCDANATAIESGMEAALKMDFDRVEMIYGKGTASGDILRLIKTHVGETGLAVKTFHDLSVNS